MTASRSDLRCGGRLLLACALVLGSPDATAGEATRATGDDARLVTPFLAQHCAKCHDAQKQKGDFRIDTLARDFTSEADAERWAEVLLRLSAGEMPPKQEPRPQPAEQADVVAWISARLNQGKAERMAKRSPVTHYRLSRDEYANTVYDLLGVRYDPAAPGALNEDPRWHGFERIGAMLTLSPSHIDRYLKAAETVLARAFPEKTPTAVKGRRDAIALQGRDGDRKRFQELGVENLIRKVIWPGHLVGGINPAAKGELVRMRIQLSGMRPVNGRAPHLTVWDNLHKRSIFDQDIVTAEDQPVVVELLTTSEGVSILNDTAGPVNEGHTFNVTNGTLFISSKDTRLMRPEGRKLTDDAGQAIHPLLLVDWVEWEGPVITDDERKRREGFFPAQPGDLAQARAGLVRFAERAWRRPLAGGEIDRYVAIMERERAAGEPLRTAVLAAMAGVLTSKNFIYLVEGSARERRDRLDDWELAARLSYFLWGSLPDDGLVAAARAGTVRDPQQLRSQVARMLADGKISRFTEAFPRQWLQLHRLGMFPPDSKLYPDYDKWLEQSMALESIGYFTEMFNRNLPLREFLDSDWTVVNPRLAWHYGMPAPSKPGFQRVTLRPEDHRGGLLTQAAILSLTSDGTRHRPVHRGVWLSEALFAHTPPPPPPNIEPIDAAPPASPAKASIRMQLAAHATNPTCASCHARIDPFGFAFDHFDAIGRWRSEEVVAKGTGPNPRVDASGTLADGRTFRGPEEFRKLLVQDLDRFAVAFVENLATFALRRTMTLDDAEAIRAIATAAKTDDYRLRSLIERFATSELFLRR